MVCVPGADEIELIMINSIKIFNANQYIPLIKI